tara:strand:- start:53 stop:511 length:459 start_codon:yes stop_codon:yes gene_type:complete
MKISKEKLKQIITEELKKQINTRKKQLSENQSEPFVVTHKDYGNSAEFQFNGFDTPYDQTFADFKIKLDDGRVIETGEMHAGIDTKDLAQNLAAEIFSADEGYWFLNPDYAGEDDYNNYVGALLQNLEAKGIDPGSQGDTARSYRDRDSGGF